MDEAMQRLHDLLAIVDSHGCETREEGIEAARVAGAISQDDAEMLVRFQECVRQACDVLVRDWLDQRRRELLEAQKDGVDCG